MQDLIGRTLGKYRLVERLGRGGMAEVYKAFQPSLDRYVAIKILHPFMAEERDFLARFRREARNVAALRHPNIVQVFDFDVEGDLYYMVMEYLDGPSLKSRLEELHQRGKRLPLSDSIRIVHDVGLALAYAHARDLVHRDVKPANVILDASGRVILTDFGVAKILTGTQFTATGTILGTPAYMSPEQGMGQAGDGRSDIYSLGVMLYEMATGRLPFDADTPLAVVMKHVNEPLPLPRTIAPEVPEAIERVVLRAMAKDPADRYATVDEMLKALDGALTGPAPTAPVPVEPAFPSVSQPGREGPPQPAVGRRPGSRPALALAAGGGLGLFLCAGVLAVGGLIYLGREWLSGAAPSATVASATEPAQPTRTRAPTRTRQPTRTGRPPEVTTTPLLPNGNVLFRDDFSDPGSGWDQVSDENGLTNYWDRTYRIVVDEPQTDRWANPGEDFTDVIVEVDAFKAGGPNDNNFGIICRYQGLGEYYAFFISSDGFYSITKIVDGEYDFMGLTGMLESDSILQGSSTNHIRAECVGNTMRLYANGDLLQELEDGDYADGDVGLIAGTFDLPGTDIRFDNFVVYSPR
jgi:serine/threonine protein kinase